MKETELSEIEDLKQALEHESQYKKAIVSDALFCYEINLSKDLIEKDFSFYNEKGEYVSFLNYIGLEAPCKFSDFLKTWSKKILNDISRTSLSDLDILCKKLISLYNKGTCEYVVDYWGEYRNGRLVFINQTFIMVKHANGDIYALSIVKDYTQIKLMEENTYQKELERYAYYDPITNGYNYIKFKEQLRRMMIPGSIISLDIHSFKLINTICGVQKGDEVIRRIWDAIYAIIDTENNDIAAHVNADHFIIYTPQTEETKIIQLLKNISLAISIISGDLAVPQLMPYFGITKWDTDKLIESSYNEAIAAKHNAKKLTDKNYAFFNEKDTERMIVEKEMLDSFEDALAKKEFKIWFQPKFNPISRNLIGAEALVRWIKKDGSVIPPNAFIPLFERSNIIRRLDEYIFRNVCAQQKQWLDAGKDIVPVSVNLSRASLHYKDIVKFYKRITNEVGIDKKFIPIEITESATADTLDIRNVMSEFISEGFLLHIDDFGSGYSSLSSLNVLHFETLKIDKSLVDYIGNFEGNRLLEHIISMAKDLGLHVTAEGVENESQAVFLKHIGVDSIQGFFFSKPVPLPDFEQILNTQKSSENSMEYYPVAKHISEFKRSFTRSSLYICIINLTQNRIIENAGVYNIKSEIGHETTNFREIVFEILDKLVLEESREVYINNMDPAKIIERLTGDEYTNIFSFKRYRNNKIVTMRTITHTFRVENSNDIWLYLNVSPID